MNVKKNSRGITLIALVITILVLLILAGVTIATLTGDNGIITNAQKAKFETEIREIEEQIKLNNLQDEPKNKFGTINEILNINSKYNEIIMLENSNLVYDPDKISEKEKNWLEEMGIHSKSNYYLIMMEETKKKFLEQSNIGTIEEFRELVNNNNFHYDIAYIIENIKLNYDKSNQWIPIGNSQYSFNGTLDGSDYSIDGIYIDTLENYQGLFGYSTGTIKNLNLENSYICCLANSGGLVAYNNGGEINNCKLNNSQIIANGDNVGGLVGVNINGEILYCSNFSTVKNTGNYATGGIVGWNNNESLVINCINSSEVTGNIYVGGIVGTNENNSKIENSYNIATIISESTIYDDFSQRPSAVGGICGMNRISIINQSYNTGTILGNGYGIGGISGRTEEGGMIENCYNNADIVNTEYGSQIGGICGAVIGNSTIKQCYNSGNISGLSIIGGIVGHLGDTTVGQIENCYNTGSLSSNNSQIGGIAGLTRYGNIKNCYSVGPIISTTLSQGGITSYRNDTISYIVSNCFYLDTICVGGINQQDIPGQAESKTATEMKQSDFIILLNKNNDGIWVQDTNNINNGYPVLNWQ